MQAAPGYFGRLPQAACEVRLVEPFHEEDMAFAFYWAPSGDGERPGIYYVNGYDLPNRPLHILASVTFHEAVPGHHFQLAIEQEMPDRPALRRFAGIRAGSAFSEGWGLYSERLADEMGLYLDEWERLGMADAQIHRAARLVTDTGLHALGWTRERAIDKLEEGGVPHTDAVIEVDRYIAEPAQALSYMIGMIEIERARAAADATPGFAPRLPRPGAWARPAAVACVPARDGSRRRAWRTGTLSRAAARSIPRKEVHHGSRHQVQPVVRDRGAHDPGRRRDQGRGRRDDQHVGGRRDRDEGPGRRDGRPEALGARRRELLHQHLPARPRAASSS